MKGWILSGDIEEDFLCLRKRIYLEVESQQRSRLPFNTKSDSSIITAGIHGYSLNICHIYDVTS